MLVETWMSKPVITVNADDSMQQATALLKEHHIGILPVMENEKLLGIITDRDLKRASASDATSLEIHELVYLLCKIKAKEIMTKDPIVVPAYYTIEETARILLEKKISGVPVVDDDGRVAGIITRDDLLRVLVNMTGVDKLGIQFALRIEDSAKSILEITDIIRKYEGHMVSIMTSYEKAPRGYRNVCIRAYRVNRHEMPQLLNDLKKKAMLLYVVDHRNDFRNIQYRFA
jgi:acetoin utilization protein AcuB